jgi:hypothetical protein
LPAQLILGLAAAGLAAGLGMLVRGLRAQRSAARIGDTGTSRVGMLAAGEVRISGEVVPAGVTLTSRLRLRPCVYERTVIRDGTGKGEHTVMDEHRAVGFFIRDVTGEIRVFPRSARWEVPLDAETAAAAGGEWTGVAGLLVAADDGDDPLHPGRSDAPDFAMPALVGISGSAPAARELGYREARIEPGQVVSVVGRALPFRDLADPTEADHAELDTLTGAVDGNHVPDLGALEDPEVAASYARAREEGILLTDPVQAWGNAAIEGFGIGRPVRLPELDPGVTPARPGTAASSAGLPGLAGFAEPLAPVLAPLAAATLPPSHVPPRASAPSAAADAVSDATSATDRSFEIPPDALVIAAGPDIPLLIAAGTPGEAYLRNEQQFLLGLLGATLAIGSALLLALALSGALGPLGGS